MKTKSEIRNDMRALRRQVPDAARAVVSASICDAITSRADVEAALLAKKPFAVYLASKEEIDLSELIEQLWSLDITVAVPCWDAENKEYKLGVYDTMSALIEGMHHIPEPAESNTIDEADIGVWIVPGLAFTEDGLRLGYGGGWYDRLLSNATPEAIVLGVAYPFQVVDSLPIEEHDRRLSGVVTAEPE